MVEKIALIVDDQKNIRNLFKDSLRKENFILLEAENGEKALDILRNSKVQVCFLDNEMHGRNGIEVLRIIKDENISVPIILITGHGNMEIAIEAIQLGAYEYTTKPINLTKIRLLANRACEVYQLNQKIKKLEEKVEFKHGEYELIGNDPILQNVFKSIGSVTTTPVTTNVFIHGESGTGKELIARAIHNYGATKDHLFVDINCTALPEDLLESELFGHEKGAFTGAINKKIGKFEFAESGTIFLDEIGDLSRKLQKKLLRVLQERTFERLGSNQKIKVKARIISATNKDIAKEVEQGIFRKDLFYRINEVSIFSPPLRERKSDIPLLAEVFCKEQSTQLNKDIYGIDNDALGILTGFDYPGNIRELKNIIKSAVMYEQSNLLTAESLAPNIKKHSALKGIDFSFKTLLWKQERTKIIEQFEKEFVIHLLKHTNGNLTKASEITQLKRTSLHQILKKFNLSSLDFRTK